MMTEYTPEISLSEYRHLVLGDISGIQDFIFNVKSEGAAKTLKGRSFFVHALSELALAVLDEALPDNCLLFYNGGGNFYVFCKTVDETAFAQTRRTIQRELANSELYLTLCHTPLLHDFSLTWKNLHEAANREKLQKFADWFSAFAPGERPESEYWKTFVKRLTRSNGYHLDILRSKSYCPTASGCSAKRCNSTTSTTIFGTAPSTNCRSGHPICSRYTPTMWPGCISAT